MTEGWGLYGFLPQHTAKENLFNATLSPLYKQNTGICKVFIFKTKWIKHQNHKHKKHDSIINFNNNIFYDFGLFQLIICSQYVQVFDNSVRHYYTL